VIDAASLALSTYPNYLIQRNPTRRSILPSAVLSATLFLLSLSYDSVIDIDLIMEAQLVLASTPADGVRVLALNRPSKRNALSQELITVFLEQLNTASRDDGVRVIVITGSSSFFCGTVPCPNHTHTHTHTLYGYPYPWVNPHATGVQPPPPPRHLSRSKLVAGLS
jgi:hypothetical protein